MSGSRPVDGYTVEHTDESVVLTLSNRYGDTDRYEFSREDALRIGHAMVEHAEDEWA